MDVPDLSWRRTAEARWTARDLDGYVLHVLEGPRGWRWSLTPPGAGYVVSRGEAPSREEAMQAVADAHRALLEQIDAGHQARLDRLGEK